MKKMILLITLISMVVFVSGTLAQQKPASAPAPAPAATPAPSPAAPAKEEKAVVEKLTGVIEKVDEIAKTVVVKDAKGEKTFAIDAQTKIIKGGKEMPFAELKKGMIVSVEFSKIGEKMVAGTIKAAAPKTAKKK